MATHSPLPLRLAGWGGETDQRGNSSLEIKTVEKDNKLNTKDNDDEYAVKTIHNTVFLTA